MTISCRPPDAASVPMTERPAFDRRRAPSVCVIVSLVHSLYALMGLGEADDDRAFTVLRNPGQNQLRGPTEQPAY